MLCFAGIAIYNSVFNFVMQWNGPQSLEHMDDSMCTTKCPQMLEYCGCFLELLHRQ